MTKWYLNCILQMNFSFSWFTLTIQLMTIVFELDLINNLLLELNPKLSINWQIIVSYLLGLKPLSQLVPDSQTPWLPLSGRFVETLDWAISLTYLPTVLTNHSLMRGLWNFNRASLTIIKLRWVILPSFFSCNLLLTAVTYFVITKTQC